MEELKHYSGLRDKYSKQLQHDSYDLKNNERPRTAVPKQVNFHLSDQFGLREFRNLREKHFSDFERMITPPNHEPVIIEKKKKKHKKKKNYKENYFSNFEVITKPVVDIEAAEIKKLLSDSHKNIEVNNNMQQISSRKKSDISEASAISKKSLREDMEDAFLEAKQALENSFSRPPSQLSENSQSKFSNHEEKKNQNVIIRGKTLNANSNKVEFNSSKNEINNTLHSDKLDMSANSLNKYTNQALNKHIISENLQIFKKDAHLNANPKRDESNISIHTEIEEKISEGSPKSSVDFTLSDQTPFESIKFSQDINPKVGFNQYFDNFKKGIYHRLLSPIIQNLHQENYSDKQSIDEEDSQQFNKRQGSKRFEDFEEKSPKGSLKNGENQRIIDFNLRTSRSEPFDNLIYEDSVYSHCSMYSMPNQYDINFEPLQKLEISIMNEPEIPKNNLQLKIEKAIIMLKALEDTEICLMATNVCLSFLKIKSRSAEIGDKIQKNSLAIANYEFNLLRKVVKF